MVDLGAVKAFGTFRASGLQEITEEVVETKRRPRVEAVRELGVLAIMEFRQAC